MWACQKQTEAAPRGHSPAPVTAPGEPVRPPHPPYPTPPEQRPRLHPCGPLVQSWSAGPAFFQAESTFTNIDSKTLWAG